MKEVLTYLGPLSSIFTLFGLYITYRLNIKAKYRERDINEEYELNIILANLLDVWYFLKLAESIINKIPEAAQRLKENQLPEELAPVFARQALDMQDDSCFEELEKSICNLKKYDPITYYKHVGTGTRAGGIRSIATFLSSTGQYVLQSASRSAIEDALDDVRTSIEKVSGLISGNVRKRVAEILEDTYDNNDSNEMVNAHFQQFIEAMEPRFKLLLQNIPRGMLVEMLTKSSLQECFEQLRSDPTTYGNGFGRGLDELVRLTDGLSSNPD